MSYIIIIIFVVVFLVGTPLYMKFVVPKLTNKMNERKAEADKEFAERGDGIIHDFLSDPNKFGLLKESLQGHKIYGIANGEIHENVKLSDKVKSEFISHLTLTREVDMTIGYLVAAEDGMHYMVFDGTRCLINDVFEYSYIRAQELTKSLYTFDYKGEHLKFHVSETLILYPRFEVHEVMATGSGQGSIRTVNSFVRQWFAWEPTNNVEYNTRVLHKVIGQGVDLVQKKEFFMDQIIRTQLFNGFLQKLNVTRSE